MQGKTIAVLTGKAQPYGPKGELSAYRKIPSDTPLSAGPNGFVGDEQADRKHHGGVDKAILQYAYEHYTMWRQTQPHLQSELTGPGAFGENISSEGMTEASVCIGDRYRVGRALVEVSQARQPCWKLGHRFGDPAMVDAVLRNGCCGWYYRVIENGTVAAGDAIELQDRPHPDWPVSRVFDLLLGGRADLAALKVLAKLDVLSVNWQERARRKLHNLKMRSG
jgi:MOSC domain-containing protein YiiM